MSEQNEPARRAEDSVAPASDQVRVPHGEAGDTSDEILEPLAKDAVLAELLKTLVLEHYSGPLPPPQLLRQYDEILPGCAERVLKEWETEADHRRSLQRRALDTDIRYGYLGMGAAFLVALCGFGLSYALIMAGHDLGGAAFGATTLGSLVTVFIKGTKSQREEPRSRPRARGAEKRD